MSDQAKVWDETFKTALEETKAMSFRDLVAASECAAQAYSLRGSEGFASTREGEMRRRLEALQELWASVPMQSEFLSKMARILEGRL